MPKVSYPLTIKKYLGNLGELMSFSKEISMGKNLKDVKININEPHTSHTIHIYYYKVCRTLKNPISIQCP